MGVVRIQVRHLAPKHWIALLVALAGLGIGVPTLLLGGGGPPSSGSLNVSSWAAYRQPNDNWWVRYPTQWHLQPYEYTCGPGYGSRGALLSNVDHEFKRAQVPRGCTTEWEMRGLPSGLVVVDFGWGAQTCCPMQHGPDTQFPLSLDSAQRMYAVHEDPGEPYGAPQPSLYIPVSIADPYHFAHDFEANVWIGADATQLDRQLAHSIVASIRVGAQVPYFVPGPSPSP